MQQDGTLMFILYRLIYGLDQIHFANYSLFGCQHLSSKSCFIFSRYYKAIYTLVMGFESKTMLIGVIMTILFATALTNPTTSKKTLSCYVLVSFVFYK